MIFYENKNYQKKKKKENKNYHKLAPDESF